MESSNVQIANQEPSPPSSVFDFKTILILVLILIIYLTYLGINIIPSLANTFQILLTTFSKITIQVLGDTSYSTGKILNETADIVSDTAKGSIDIAEGAVQNVGNLLQSARSENRTNVPEHDNPENPIQKPISSSKYNWCLVGEYQNRRGCVPVTESDKCLSNQIFPTQKMCLNPNLSAY